MPATTNSPFVSHEEETLRLETQRQQLLAHARAMRQHAFTARRAAHRWHYRKDAESLEARAEAITAEIWRLEKDR